MFGHPSLARPSLGPLSAPPSDSSNGLTRTRARLPPLRAVPGGRWHNRVYVAIRRADVHDSIGHRGRRAHIAVHPAPPQQPARRGVQRVQVVVVRAYVHDTLGRNCSDSRALDRQQSQLRLSGGSRNPVPGHIITDLPVIGLRIRHPVPLDSGFRRSDDVRPTTSHPHMPLSQGHGFCTDPLHRSYEV